METKGLLRSQTVLGAVIAALPAFDALAVALGLIAVPLLGPVGTIITSATGATVATQGRINADKKIKGIF